MGVNKKFLLLAVIILGMQTESYATIWTKATDMTVTQEEINKHITASNSKAQVIAIQSGGTATINKDVTVDITKIKDDKDHLYSKFINVASESKDKISVNNGNITIKNESGNQFEVVSMQSGTFQNAGNISISGAKGIGFNITGAAKAENTGTFNIDNKAVGVNISHANAEFINGEEGKITVTGGTGILQTAGTVTNLGSINVSAGATGLDLQGGSFENTATITNEGKINISSTKDNYTGIDNKGTINNSGEIKVNASGENGVGIQLNADNATLTSTGTITVEAGTGVKVSKGTFINEEKGQITVKKGTGIYQAGGTLTNNGTVTVEGGNGFITAKGNLTNTGTITVNNGNGIVQRGGEITNTGKISVAGGTGVKVSNGTFTNSGSINISQGAIGLDLQGGKFENTGTITNDGEMNLSSTLTQKGTVTNNGKVTINVAGSGAGINQSTGTFTNNSQVDVNGGKGFFVQGGEIINNGTINVNAATGLQLQGETAKFTNNNLIDVKKGTGVIVSGETKNKEGEIVSTFVNSTNGKITVAAGQKGLQITKGKAENQGTINALKEKATGVYLGAITIEKVEDKNNPPTTKPSKYDSPGSFENNGTINVLGKEAKGIHIGAGVVNNIAEKGKIEAKDGAIGVYMQSLKAYVFNEKENSFEENPKEETNVEFTNAGEIIASGKVVEQVLKEDGTPDLDENGNPKYKTTVSKGIFLNSKGTATNNGSISVSEEAIGVQVNNADAQFINNANITIADSSQGIQVNNGLATNAGSIIATGVNAAGVYINGKNGNFENKEKAQILISGVGAKAIHFGTNGGTANNTGIIKVTSGGIGAYFGGNGTFNNLKDSNIIVSGKVVEIKDENGNETTTTVSKGIFLNSKGTATNNGNISVSEEAIGVQVNNADAKFINNANITVADSSQGIQVNNGLATNNGDIIATGNNATGIYLNAAEKEDKTYENAKFENKKGTIIASGENAKGIFFGLNGGTVTNSSIIEVSNKGTGVFSYKGNEDNPSKNQNNFTNGKAGIINVYGEKSVGLLLDTLNDKGKVVNDGTINIYDQGTGVKLGGTTFTNSGTIEVKNSGLAIESAKETNNTIVLKNGSKIKGNIKGNTGVDILAVEGGGEYKDLSITSYDKIVSLKNENSTDDAVISNSNISLEFNDGTKNYTNTELEGAKTGLTISDSNLIVDLKSKKENSSSLVDTGDEKLKLAGKMKLAFMSGNGQKEFNISEILGDKIEIGEANFGSSAMWDYIKDENGDLIAKKHSYIETVGKSQLEDFGKVLEQNESIGGDFGKGLTLLGLLDASQFTDAMTQLSGGVHGYTVDFAAINSRTISNTIKNRELSKDKSRNKALNSYDQDVVYINNNHQIGGLMNVDYNEDGVLGITEKQIMPNGKFGLIYGGAKGKAEFENGKHGKANMDNLYLGGYYAYDFTDKLTLVSNANFVYSHTDVTRNIKFAKDNDYLDYSYDSTYPVFGFGGGATLYYTPYNSLNNSVTLYGGIDWTKIVQGNINENPDVKEDTKDKNLTIKNIPVDEHMYDSVVPHIGLSLLNNGYIFNRKYRLGVNIDYETELGNIKNGKKLKLSALSTPHRVKTAERENIVSYSLNGALDLTEDFTIYGNYTKADSDEYDAERVEAGFKYKMDRMSDLFVTGPLLGNIENSKPYSNRWTGMFSIILDGTEDSNRSYYNNVEKDKNESHSRGDYATSFRMKPKFTLSLNDRETNWSYYFETYYSRNDMFMELDHNERRSSESRIHGEARWHEQYSKGKYGFNIGYRNETSSSPIFSQYLEADRQKRGTHQFRFTPNFTYNLGNGFVFGGQTTGIIAYEYEGYRKGQTDFEIENEYGITYNGLMPKLRLTVNYFREDTWYDNDFTKKARLNPEPGVYVYDIVRGEKRYQSNQLRPRITYFFGNGGRVELSARIPLGNGGWHNSGEDNKKSSEKYETRYGLKYYQPIAPGLTGMIGGEILTTKTKSTSGSNYGKETRDYSIRPAIGISYNF